MKPRRIILLRHGECAGNVDPTVYQSTPDWKIPLTDKGRRQAEEAAEKLTRLIGHGEKIMAYCSPLYRARETYVAVDKRFAGRIRCFEDPRLREQEWGNYQEAEIAAKIERERDKFSSFFYRMPFGESGADVYDRMTTFLDTLYRDFAEEDFPQNVLIVSHGLTIKAFLMRWFHWSIEKFDAVRNPKNCAIIIMRLNQSTNKYMLNPLEERA